MVGFPVHVFLLERLIYSQLTDTPLVCTKTMQLHYLAIIWPWNTQYGLSNEILYWSDFQSECHRCTVNETSTIPVTIFELKILKETYNLIILIENSEKWLTVIFEPSLCQQSASEVFDLLKKLLDESEIPLQKSKIRYRPLCWALNDPETSWISRPISSSHRTSWWKNE